MTRQEKYPETATFHYHNANPKNRLTGDCVVRALCTALNKPYEEVLRELVESSLKSGYSVSSTENYARYLKESGWVKHPQPRKWDNTKFTGEEWCREVWQHYRGCGYERMIAHIGGGHIVAIIGFKVWDTWDSTEGCIGNYWVKG